jgi:hypothetical protein
VTADDVADLTSGLFDYANPDNPVANYDTVFVPYCTGDVHSGDAVVTFDADSDDMEDVTAYFKGFTNSQTVLAWVYENFMDPGQIFVTGSSAGGYGATTASPFIMNHYPDTTVIHMADAANGVTPPAWEGLNTWGFFDWLATADFVPELAALTPDTFTMTSLYSVLTSAYPENSFAQYNTFLDQVQVAFYGFQTGRNVTESEAVFIEVAGEWSRQLIVNLVNINSRAPNFAYYTAGGLRHTINHVDQFYTYEYDGVTVADWVTGLLAGEQGQDVFCSLGDECLAAPPGEEIATEG